MSQENQNLFQLPASEPHARLETPSDIAVAQGINDFKPAREHQLQVQVQGSCGSSREVVYETRKDSRKEFEGTGSVNLPKSCDDERRFGYPLYTGLTLPFAGSSSNKAVNSVSCKAFDIPPSVVLRRALLNEPAEGGNLSSEVMFLEGSRDEVDSQLNDMSGHDDAMAHPDSPDLLMYSMSDNQSVPMPVESTYFGSKELTPVARETSPSHKQASSDGIRIQRKRKVARQKQRQRKQKATEGVKMVETSRDNQGVVETPVAMEIDSGTRDDEIPVLEGDESVSQGGCGEQTSAEVVEEEASGEAWPGFLSVMSLPTSDTDGGKEKKPSVASKKKQKNKRHAKENGGRRPFPTHFIGIRVAEQNIHDLVAEIQRDVVEKEEKLSGVLVDQATLHLTLKVLSLEGNEQINLACETMQSCADVLEPLRLSEDPLTLEFKGLGNFRNQVVFVNVEEGPCLERLKTMADLISQHFTAAGLPPCDSHQAYSAHMTVMKLSRMKRHVLKKLKPRKIDPELYSQWADAEFGSSIVSDIQLLQMNRKDEDGFYTCLSKIIVSGDGISPGPAGGMSTSTPCNKEGSERMEPESTAGIENDKMEFDESSEPALIEDGEGSVMEYSDTLPQMSNQVQVEAEETQTGVEEIPQQTEDHTEQTLGNLGAERGSDSVAPREDLGTTLTNSVTDLASGGKEINAKASIQAVEITSNEEMIEQRGSTEELEPQSTDTMGNVEDLIQSPTEKSETEVEDQSRIVTVETFTELEEEMNAVSENVQLVSESREVEGNDPVNHSEESALDTTDPVTCVQAEVKTTKDVPSDLMEEISESKDATTVAEMAEELCEEVTIQEADEVANITKDSTDNVIDLMKIVPELKSGETATGMVEELSDKVTCQEADKEVKITEDSPDEAVDQTEQVLKLEGQDTSALMVEELHTEVASQEAGEEVDNIENSTDRASDQMNRISESENDETTESMVEEELHKEVTCQIDGQIDITENSVEKAIDQTERTSESTGEETLEGMVEKFHEEVACPEADEQVDITEHQTDKAIDQMESISESRAEVTPMGMVEELHEEEASLRETTNIIESQSPKPEETQVTASDTNEDPVASNSDAVMDQTQATPSVDGMKPSPGYQDGSTGPEENQVKLFPEKVTAGDDSSVGNSDTPETDEDGVHSCFKETEV